MANKKDAPQTHIESASEAAEIAKQKAEEAAAVAAAEAKVKAAEEAAKKLEAEASAEDNSQEDVQPAVTSEPAVQKNAQGYLKRLDAWLNETFPNNRGAVLGGVAGLIVALLFFAIGFWNTLFIVVLVLIGVAAGQYIDGDPKLVRAIQKLIKKR